LNELAGQVGLDVALDGTECGKISTIESREETYGRKSMRKAAPLKAKGMGPVK
jgi:hypothetical protein